MKAFYNPKFRSPPSAAHPMGVVLWDNVDPWLIATCKIYGALERLQKFMGITKSSLNYRRHVLRLPPLPKGRTPSHRLTPLEVRLQTLLNEGLTHMEIAMRERTNRKNITARVAKLLAKEALALNYCDKCEGLGLEECTTCHQHPERAVRDHNGKIIGAGHFHICSKCNGESVYRGDNGKPLQAAESAGRGEHSPAPQQQGS